MSTKKHTPITVPVSSGTISSTVLKVDISCTHITDGECTLNPIGKESTGKITKNHCTNIIAPLVFKSDATEAYVTIIIIFFVFKLVFYHSTKGRE